ncbi:MAG: ATP-binding protein [Pyrinomonadaceae bacterium MAG19_C2-C3]|nr:ATP-binding protein [Pyrinomonadaceae bacterium MAG19_C2-C3]
MPTSHQSLLRTDEGASIELAMDNSSHISSQTEAVRVPSKRSRWWLIAGRAGIAAALLAAGGLSTVSDLLFGSRMFSLSGATLWLLATTLILSGIYAVIQHFSLLPIRTQIAVQLGLDVLLVTWLVWATGDLRSPYVAFYIVIISLASVYQGARGALITSVGCATGYTAAMIVRLFGGEMFGDEIFGGESFLSLVSTPAPSLADSVQIIALNTVAFFVVALLAARFAERHTRSLEATNELAHLRALHERIVESIRSGVVTTDLKGNIFTVNHAAEEITGYTAASIRGQHASRMFGELDERFEESISAAQTGDRSPRYETEVVAPDGLMVRLGFSIFPLSTQTGERSGYVITFQDLTELRTLEDVARRQDRLAAVGRVAAGIAHEIRNPLASISGSVQVLRAEAAGDSMQTELMDIILRESDRLNRIINDYLTYARPRPVELAETDVRQPLSETFALLRHSPETLPAHTLELDLPAAPVRISVDGDALKQVFSNLARNSLKAMPDGGRLHAALRQEKHGRTFIVFTDEGCGMSPNQVERLFEPFSSSTTGGTGLGLSIVYQIVRDHSGTINVRSQQGVGTTITIELPSTRETVT